MSKFFTEEDGQTCKWEACIFCKRKWLQSSLELELCPNCLKALRDNPEDYDGVRLEQLLKYGEFSDSTLAEAVRMLHTKVKNE